MTKTEQITCAIVACEIATRPLTGAELDGAEMRTAVRDVMRISHAISEGRTLLQIADMLRTLADAIDGAL